MIDPSYFTIFAQEMPSTWYELALLPGFFSVFAAILWIGGKIGEMKSGKKSYWKFLAIPLILLAIFNGFPIFWKYFFGDIFYKEMLSGFGRKMVVTHLVAGLLPFLVIIGILIWEFFEKRASADRY